MLVHNTVEAKFHVRHATIIQGAAHFIELVNKDNDKTYYVFNVYLDAGDEANWQQQIKTLHDWKCPPNSIYMGDFNHVTSPDQRSGFHKDKTKYSNEIFDHWIKDCELEEIEQPYHTFYGKREGRLFSSQIDKVYTNFDYVTLDTLRPKAAVMTCVPYSIAQYDKLCSAEHGGAKDRRDVTNGQRVLQDYTLVKEGGTHITDHLPIRIKFGDQRKDEQTKFFPTHALNRPEFLPTFVSQWERELRPSNPFAKWHELKQTIFDVAKKMKKTHNTDNRSTDVYNMIRLLRVLERPEEEQTRLLAHYDHFPRLEEWRANPDALVQEINNKLAEAAYDTPSADPNSKLAYLSATLPKGKTKLDSIYDPDEMIVTEDPQRITEVLHRFWKDKWLAKPTSKTQKLFRCYGKTIKQPAKPITLEDVEQVILDTGDTAPGPDAIPFAAYRAVVNIAAPILHTCINKLRRGAPPPSDFNEGLLVLLPKKGLGTIEDTRPLVINNTDNRIIASCIKDSINDALESILSDHQNGFRDGRSTDSNVTYFNEKFYSALEDHRYYDILFADFQKAFDSVNHEAIFTLLDCVGFDNGTTNAIRALFNEAHCYSTIRGAQPVRIDFHSGVKQGCPLSPSLFILIMDVLIEMLITTTGADVKCYADDLALGIENIQTCIRTIQKCFKIFGKATGLHINTSKSAVVPTAGATSLKEHLHRVGWADMQVLGNVTYLGIPIGKDVDLDTVFKQPHDKLVARLTKYMPLKSKYSLQQRVLIWNVWIMPIMGYVNKFFMMPACYADSIDRDCALWLNKGNNIKGLHLTRPTELAGLTTPLRDIVLHNYAILNSHYEAPPKHYTDTFEWSMRSSIHKQRAHDHIQSTYDPDCTAGSNSADCYKRIINSQAQRKEYLPYLQERLDNAGITTDQQNIFFQNHSKLPKWLPDYARQHTISTIHNAHFTKRRLRLQGHCPLCESEEDSISHLYNTCTTAQQASARLWAKMNTSRQISLEASVCADVDLPAHMCVMQTMLSHSIWRARKQAMKGIKKRSEEWSRWITEDVLVRTTKSYPDFFNQHFSKANISRAYKVNYKASLGSSRGTAEQQRRATEVIQQHIHNLPAEDSHAFTDGSANPNPGPCGAGASIHHDGNTVNLSSYLGMGTNNVGELYALGMVADHFNELRTTCKVHVYTDSKLAHDAIKHGYSAGRSNRDLVKAVRKAITRYRNTGGNIIMHWIPGHSGIAGNETADALAGAGSLFSKNNCIETINLAEDANTNTFLNRIIP